jgi:hypothetical protein
MLQYQLYWGTCRKSEVSFARFSKSFCRDFVNFVVGVVDGGHALQLDMLPLRLEVLPEIRKLQQLRILNNFKGRSLENFHLSLWLHAYK